MAKPPEKSVLRTVETVVVLDDDETTDDAMPVLTAVWSLAGQETQMDATQTEKKRKKRKYKRKTLYMSKTQRRKMKQQQSEQKSKEIHYIDLCEHDPKRMEIQRQQNIDLQREREIEMRRKIDLKIMRDRAKRTRQKKETETRRSERMVEKQRQRDMKVQIQKELDLKRERKKERKLQRQKELEIQKQQELQLERQKEIIAFEMEIRREKEINKQREREIELQRQKEMGIKRRRVRELEDCDAVEEILGHCEQEPIVIEDDDPSPTYLKTVDINRLLAGTNKEPEPTKNTTYVIDKQLEQQLGGHEKDGTFPKTREQRHLGLMTAPGVIQLICPLNDVLNTQQEVNAYINEINKDSALMLPMNVNNSLLNSNSAQYVIIENYSNMSSCNGQLGDAKQNQVIVVNRQNSVLNNGNTINNNGGVLVNEEKKNGACLVYGKNGVSIQRVNNVLEQTEVIINGRNRGYYLVNRQNNVLNNNNNGGHLVNGQNNVLNNNNRGHLVNGQNSDVSQIVTEDSIIDLSSDSIHSTVNVAPVTMLPNNQMKFSEKDFITQYVKDFQISNITIDDSPTPYQLISSGNQTVELTKIGGDGAQTADVAVDWEDQIPMDLIAVVDKPILC